MHLNGEIFNPDDEDGKSGMMFYRCTLCGSVVSKWDLEKHHGCAKCANPRIKPSNLGFFEKIVQIIKHPAVWKWDTK